ncbi:MAG: hypothetical protein O7G88_18300 [bacterium]|nr:hypothetical protein [bacterium]
MKPALEFAFTHRLRTRPNRLEYTFSSLRAKNPLNEPEKALPYFLESTEVFAELGDAESEAEIWGKLAAIYEQTLADYSQALAAWEKAQEL